MLDTTKLAVSLPMVTVEAIQPLAFAMYSATTEETVAVISTSYVKEVCQVFNLYIKYNHCVCFFPPVRPVVPTGAMAISVTGSTEIITWTVPYIEYTSELYTVFYSESRDSLASSTTPIPSYSDLLLENQTYTATLTGLDAVTTYYFLVQSENSELTTRTDVMEFTTTEAGITTSI